MTGNPIDLFRTGYIQNKKLPLSPTSIRYLPCENKFSLKHQWQDVAARIKRNIRCAVAAVGGERNKTALVKHTNIQL